MMLPCLIIGDSIALGLAAALNALVPGACHVHARVGASANVISGMVPADHYRTVIVSAGSNDRGNQAIADDIARLRETLKADKVIWLYPRSAREAWAVFKVAHKQGDRTIVLNRLLSRDGVHPQHYGQVLRLIWRRRADRSALPVSR